VSSCLPSSWWAAVRQALVEAENAAVDSGGISLIVRALTLLFVGKK
jgi:hypothetical protein